jgi:hypothetical protein
MRSGLGGLGAVALLVLSPGVVLAQQSGIAIDHKDVSCIVVGKYPKMNACFAPNSDVARARVYFRPEGNPNWYYVEMKADAPCMAGVLPKPRKELLNKHVDYYVHVTDKKFTEARTLEYNPIVVSAESDCKNKPVAPYVTNAAVQVFPGLPAGFAVGGGLGTAGAVGIGAAVAGAAAGGVAIANNNNNKPATTTATTTATTQPTQTTPTTTATTIATTQPPPGFKFSFKIHCVGCTVPVPPSGPEPLTITIDMCDSTPKGDLRYFFDFDGGSFDFIGNTCQQTRTLTTAGVMGRALLTLPTTLPAPTVFDLTGCDEPKAQPALRECGHAVARVFPGKVAVSGFRVTPFRQSGTPARRLAWNSELIVDGGAGQVVANGSASVFAGKGRSTAVATGRRGENRIEAQLVQGSGRAGTWRFELSPTASFQSGSLRVIAGEVAQITGEAIVFKLKGQPGERIVFTFRTGK